jgi:hypothetical protein
MQHLQYCQFLILSVFLSLRAPDKPSAARSGDLYSNDLSNDKFHGPRFGTRLYVDNTYPNPNPNPNNGLSSPCTKPH